MCPAKKGVGLINPVKPDVSIGNKLFLHLTSGTRHTRHDVTRLVTSLTFFHDWQSAVILTSMYRKRGV